MNTAVFEAGGLIHFSIRDLKLCASFIQFLVPLLHVVQVRQQEEHAGPLRGCALCISVDGTIAVIAVDGFELYVRLDRFLVQLGRFFGLGCIFYRVLHRLCRASIMVVARNVICSWCSTLTALRDYGTSRQASFDVQWTLKGLKTPLVLLVGLSCESDAHL